MEKLFPGRNGSWRKEIPRQPERLSNWSRSTKITLFDCLIGSHSQFTCLTQNGGPGAKEGQEDPSAASSNT